MTEEEALQLRKENQDAVARYEMGSTTSIWLHYGPIDERVDFLLQQKQERLDQVLCSKRTRRRGVSGSLLSLAKEILESIHSGTSPETILGMEEDSGLIQAEPKKQCPDMTMPERAPTTGVSEMGLAEQLTPVLGESKVIKIYGDKAMRQYIQARAEKGQTIPPAYERIVEQKLVTIVCERCQSTVTEWRYPSRGPSYCSDECRQEAHRAQTRERVRRYRERKGKATQ